jgi:hypothetical protein
MGAILNSLPLNETDNLGKLSPHRADWLTSYADATGLAVVEVERLWNRFRQITGSNDQTKIYPDGNTAPKDFTNDIFARNVSSKLNRRRKKNIEKYFVAFKTFSSFESRW